MGQNEPVSEFFQLSRGASIDQARQFFHRRQRQTYIVRGYFGGRHVRYVLDE
ncbi:hypothetical protein AB0L67_41920 [Streptomyces flaveolus]|uniref:hypothetical protein n=1 Tax=Streptomyces flaveolus TaxID=67297 RepID=UPI003422E45F